MGEDGVAIKAEAYSGTLKSTDALGRRHCDERRLP